MSLQSHVKEKADSTHAPRTQGLDSQFPDSCTETRTGTVIHSVNTFLTCSLWCKTPFFPQCRKTPHLRAPVVNNSCGAGPPPPPHHLRSVVQYPPLCSQFSSGTNPLQHLSPCPSCGAATPHPTSPGGAKPPSPPSHNSAKEPPSPPFTAVQQFSSLMQKPPRTSNECLILP